MFRCSRDLLRANFGAGAAVIIGCTPSTHTDHVPVHDRRWLCDRAGPDGEHVNPTPWATPDEEHPSRRLRRGPRSRARLSGPAEVPRQGRSNAAGLRTEPLPSVALRRNREDLRCPHYAGRRDVLRHRTRAYTRSCRSTGPPAQVWSGWSASIRCMVPRLTTTWTSARPLASERRGWRACSRRDGGSGALLPVGGGQRYAFYATARTYPFAKLAEDYTVVAAARRRAP